MRIYIPRWWLRAWKPVGDWLNTDFIGKVRRIDVLIVLLGAVLTVYYAWHWGLLWGMIAALLYILSVMVGLWFL